MNYLQLLNKDTTMSWVVGFFAFFYDNKAKSTFFVESM